MSLTQPLNEILVTAFNPPPDWLLPAIMARLSSGPLRKHQGWVSGVMIAVYARCFEHVRDGYSSRQLDRDMAAIRTETIFIKHTELLCENIKLDSTRKAYLRKLLLEDAKRPLQQA